MYKFITQKILPIDCVSSSQFWKHTFPTGTQVTRVGVVNAVYEARAIPGDHKQKEEDGGVSSFGGGGGPAF